MSNSNTSTAADLLRRAAEMIAGANTPSVSGDNNRERVVDEHRRLFNRQLRVQPYANRPRARGSSSQRTQENKEKTITRTFVCLAEREQLTVPSSREKLILRENGLGEKKVQIPTNASKDQVKEVLYHAFCPLKTCGGFELLLCQENSRTKLQVVKYGSCGTDELRCLGTGRIYIRPIQIDIALGEVEDDDVHTEECLLCKDKIPLREMRAHMETCMSGASSITTESDDALSDLSPAFEYSSEERERASQPALSEGVVPEQELVVSNALSQANLSHNILVQQSSTSNAGTAVMERAIVPYEEHLRNALKETLQAMDTNTCDEPVTILKDFARRHHRGRKLDLQSDSDFLEGETNELFILRSQIFDDAMEEILRESPPIDYSLPLEVTFTGEGAQDYGGPRREFLGLVLRQIQDRLFKEEEEDGYVLLEKQESIGNNHYFGAGLFFGFSLLQGGPLPAFLVEGQIQRVFAEDLTTLDPALGTAETQFRAGLDKFGLIELLHAKPVMVFLFRKSSVLSSLTYPRLTKLLVPTLSEEGSNRRRQEEQTYRLFLRYLKEVSAGRRVNGDLSLERILKFITGSMIEPVLGFEVQPNITFDGEMLSCLPISSTCSNRLTLPIGEVVPEENEKVYTFFDYAFCNAYFGRA